MDHSVSFGGDVNYEYLILGAGPAGLQMGHHLSRAGHSYLILEAGDTPGTFFKTFPRHRTLHLDQQGLHRAPRTRSSTSAWTGTRCCRTTRRAAVHPLQPPLLPAGRRPGALPRRLRRVLRPRTSATTPASCASRGRNAGHVPAHRRARRTSSPAERLIVATGVSRPYVPPIPGIELAEHYDDVSVDPEDFVNQRVLIIGKGNSALRDRGQPDRDRGGDPRRRPALRPDGLADPLRRAPARGQQQLPRHLPAEVRRTRCSTARSSGSSGGDGQLRGLGALQPRPGETEELAYDRVIVCTGFRFDASIFADGCRPELTHQRPVPGADPGVGVGQRARPLLRRHAHPGARLQEDDQRASSTASATACAPCTGCWSRSTTARTGRRARSSRPPRGWSRPRSSASTAPRRCGSSSASSTT